MVIMKYEQIYMKCYLALLFFLRRSLCREIVSMVIMSIYLIIMLKWMGVMATNYFNLTSCDMIKLRSIIDNTFP